jgi:hypothetical protein
MPRRMRVARSTVQLETSEKLFYRGARANFAVAVFVVLLICSWSVMAAAASASNPFIVAPSYPINGLTPAALGSGDFNNDGKLDLVTANSGIYESSSSNSISVLLGNGNGTFATAVTYETGGCTPTSVLVGDFNGDGKLDIAVGDQVQGNSCSTSGGLISVLLGNGDGTFQPPILTLTSNSTEPNHMVMGDFNRDGKLDVMFTTAFGDTLFVALGNGNGTFQTPLPAGTGSYYLSSLAVGDFNGDGKLDVAASVSFYNPTGGGYIVALGNGDGSFETALQYNAGDDPDGIVVGDFNGDGKADLALVSYCSPTLFCNNGGYAGFVSILLGLGDGTFRNVGSFPAGLSPQAVITADLNGDGNADLAVVNRDAVIVFLGKGNGTFDSGSLFAGNDAPISVLAGDFNGDHKLDLILGNGADNTVSYLQGVGNGSFVAEEDFVSGGNGLPTSVTSGDFNGDGKLDLAVANTCNPGSIYHCNNGVISILLGKGDGTFKAAVNYRVGIDPQSVVTADFDHDGKLDLAVVNYCTTLNRCVPPGTLAILLGNGDGTFQGAVSYTVQTQAMAAVVGDFNNDGNLDVAVANAGSNSVSVLLGNGDGTFQKAINSTAFGAFAIAAGDFNHDGRLDLVTADGGGVDVLLGNGDGTFQTPVAIAVNPQTKSVQVADVNGDGNLDLAVASVCSSAANLGVASVLLGNGDGTFKAPTHNNVGYCPNSLSIADYNGDGKLDVAVTNGGLAYGNYYYGTVSLLFGNGDGSFQSEVTTPVPAPLFITSADVNQDGAPDLLVLDSNEYVRVLLNKGLGARE